MGIAGHIVPFRKKLVLNKIRRVNYWHFPHGVYLNYNAQDSLETML